MLTSPVVDSYKVGIPGSLEPQVGADYDPKQSGSPWSYLALVMEALSKEQGAAIVAGTRKVAGRAFLGWLAVSLR